MVEFTNFCSVQLWWVLGFSSLGWCQLGNQTPSDKTLHLFCGGLVLIVKVIWSHVKRMCWNRNNELLKIILGIKSTKGWTWLVRTEHHFPVSISARARTESANAKECGHLLAIYLSHSDRSERQKGIRLREIVVPCGQTDVTFVLTFGLFWSRL